jgi:hypothetical protein
MTRPRLSAFSVLGLCALFALSGCFAPPAAAPTSSSAPDLDGEPLRRHERDGEPHRAEHDVGRPDLHNGRPAVGRPDEPDGDRGTYLPWAPGAGCPATIYYVAIDDNGKSGQFMLGGVCDIPRAKAQLEYTAMAAAGATSAQVFVNGRPIDEVLSLN